METFIAELFDTFQSESTYRYCPQEREELLDQLERIEQEFRDAGEEKTLKRYIEAVDTWGSLSANEGTNAFLDGLTFAVRMLLLVLPKLSFSDGTAGSR